MKLLLTEGRLVGDRYRTAGETIDLDVKSAERFVKAGAAVPAPPNAAAIETAVAAQRAERATTPRQGK
jgi:hypothetical protein